MHLRSHTSIGNALLLCLVFTTYGTPVMALEPVPEILKNLLIIFPERDGWFVEEPLGATPETPEKARHFFETFRVIVPDLGALDLGVGKVLQAQNLLPIKKVSRFDRDPNAPGLPGFRGVWCQAEDKELIGVSILTQNQNRFLIWAKHQYYRDFEDKEIESKVRDWYARSAGQYLASLDAGVPDTEPPQAASRMLPDWMDLFPQSKTQSVATNIPATIRRREIRAWGLSDIVAFVPAPSSMDKFIASAPDTLWRNQSTATIQRQFEGRDPSAVVAAAVPSSITPWYHGVQSGENAFAVDRYGRIRFAKTHNPTDSMSDGQSFSPQALLFPATPVATAGIALLEIINDTVTVTHMRIGDNNCYLPESITDSTSSDVSDQYLASFGHALAAFRDRYHLDLTRGRGVLIAK